MARILHTELSWNYASPEINLNAHRSDTEAFQRSHRDGQEKGFNLRFNPDSQWSASFYKALNQIQYVDGQNILNINRDDATGFRLDTLTTCKQYTNPTVKGKEILSTRTDYVNKHPSVLQTTSYNISKTGTTSEVCIGLVKATPIHKKNPTQHFSDLLMLSAKD